MIDRICVVLEALSVVICLHHLYGKKFRFDIVTVSFLTIEMITMQAIDYFGWPSQLSMLFYPIVVIYCIIEFGFNLRKLIVNNVLNAVIMCVLQVGIMMMFYIFDKQHFIIGMRLLITNLTILLIIIFILPKLNVKHWMYLLKRKEKILIATLVIFISILVTFLTNFKQINIFNFSEIIQYTLLFTCIVFIGILAIQLLQYKVKSIEIETELRMHKLYSDSFDNLIDNIRSRQHEFDNHINTIYSQHYIYDTYDKLVEAQKGYCQIVITENKFNKLLTSGNRVIIGFLYGKFVEIDKLGVHISYHINIEEMEVGIPIYKLIEILGNLIGNAVDALVETKIYNRLYVYMIEELGGFSIEVRNESDYIKNTEIDKFFTKGYSKKGANRGMGLFHVKSICDEYGLNLFCQNKEIDEKNWISFVVSTKKETI